MFSEKTQKLRDAILAEFDEFAAAELAVLDKALEAFEMAEQAQAELDRYKAESGSIFVTNRLGEIIPHPAVRVAKDNRAQFMAGCKQLGIADPYGGGSTHGRGAQKGRKA